MTSTRFHRPTTQEGVTGLLVEFGSSAKLNAGGTDLVVQIRAGLIEVDHLIDISLVDGLDQVEELADGSVSIGAGVTMLRLLSDIELSNRYPALIDGASRVGSRQIQSRATLVGNVCNASPAADTVGPLIVHDAEVVVVGQKGKRVVPISEFALGPRRTVLLSDEWVRGVRLPARTQGGSAYEKLGRTLGVDVAVVGVSCRVGDDAVRLAVTSVAATIIRTPLAEALLLASGEFTPDVAASISDEIKPISDVRSSASYRRRVAPVLARKAWGRAGARRGEHV